MQIAYKVVKDIKEKIAYFELCAYLMKPDEAGPSINKLNPVLNELVKFIN